MAAISLSYRPGCIFSKGFLWMCHKSGAKLIIIREPTKYPALFLPFFIHFHPFPPFIYTPAADSGRGRAYSSLKSSCAS